MDIVYKNSLNDKWYNCLSVVKDYGVRTDRDYLLTLKENEYIDSNSYFDNKTDANIVYAFYTNDKYSVLRPCIYKKTQDSYKECEICWTVRIYTNEEFTYDENNKIDERLRRIIEYNSKREYQKSINLCEEPLRIEEIVHKKNSLHYIQSNLAVSYYYINCRRECYRLSDLLYFDRLNNVKSDKNNILRYYCKDVFKGLEYQEVSFSTKYNYFVSNTSLCDQMAAVRTVNYIHNNGVYNSMDQDKHIRTKTYLCELNDDFSIKNHKLIENNIRYIEHRKTMVENIEDMRIFKFKENYWCIGTGIDTHYERSHQMVLLKLKGNQAEKMYTLRYNSWLVQKNWIPFIYEDSINFIYSFEPFTILRLNEDSGEVTKVKEIKQKIDCSSIRGSTNIVLYEDKYVCVTHVVFTVNKERNYLQKFIEFNKDFEITRCSSLFTLRDDPVEYSMGLTYKDNTFYLTSTENDMNTRIYKIPQQIYEDNVFCVND